MANIFVKPVAWTPPTLVNTQLSLRCPGAQHNNKASAMYMPKSCNGTCFVLLWAEGLKSEQPNRHVVKAVINNGSVVSYCLPYPRCMSDLG